MTPRRQQVKAVLAGALERAPEGRAAYLDQVCTDPDLRREVESLLAPDEGDSRLSESPMVEPSSGLKLGPYEIVGRLGMGGMGAVYRARDSRLEREVAIKMLPLGWLADEAARKRFHKEALALARLNHPNIAAVYDVGEQDGTDYLVMECVPGRSLAEEVRTRPLPEKEILGLAAQIAAALQEAHEQGVLHRDLKPENIMVTPKRQAKVLDFGLAKMMQQTKADPLTVSTETLTQNLAGTLPYMAPEQLRGEPADVRTDLHALGAVLFELAAGKRPYQGDSVPQLIDAVLHQAPVAPRALNARISPELERIILKCLEKEPESRYQSAKEVAVDLQRLRTSVTSATPPQARPPWPSTKSVGLGLGVLASVILLLIAFNIGHLRQSWRGASGAPRIESLAVLPVKNFSGDPQQEYFADGMTDALIAGLAQIKAVKVISCTSAMHYKGTNETLPQIARELGVDGIIEASVMRSGDRLRLTAQLIDARHDRHLWASNYERNVTDVLALQAELVQTIGGEIRVQLTPQESERLKTTRRVDPEVYDTTLRGKATLEYATDEEQIRQAIELFQTAVDRDPTYAPAWAGLGEALWTLAATGFEFVAPDDVRGKAIAAAEKALQLDGNLPEAHKARAAIALDGDWDLEMAQQHFENALELRPGYAAAHALYSQILELLLGRPEEARRHLDRARELDPLSPWNDVNLVSWWTYEGRLDKALEEGERARRRHPSLWMIPTQMGFVYLLQEQPDRAVSEFEAALKLSPGQRPTDIIASLGLAYGLAGRRADALKILADLERASRMHYVSPYHRAVVYSGLGRMDEAFRLLDFALEQRTPSLALCVPNDASSAALRRDPRWRTFLTRLRQQVKLPPGAANPYF
jgi:serine/threonine-protein kinase